MKKFVFALSCVAALLFTGCAKQIPDLSEIDASKLDDTKKKCWEIVVTIEGSKSEGSTTYYVWGTEKECVVAGQGYVAAAKLLGSVKATYKSVNAKDDETCLSKNTEK